MAVRIPNVQRGFELSRGRAVFRWLSGRGHWRHALDRQILVLRQLTFASFCVHLALFGVCAVTIVPFVWMFGTSLKAPNEVFEFRPLPASPTFDNYEYMWRAIPMGA